MRYKRSGHNPFAASILLIVVALIIVSGSRILAEQKDTEIKPLPSYGFQAAVSNDQREQTPEVNRQSDFEPGVKIDEYKGVAVYSNGTDYMSSHGLHYSEDGYYYGYKWQCVEFVKRFYYERFNHSMPDGAGNAKYFFNTLLEQGEFNQQRGLYQYRNGGDVRPQADDLLVFTKGTYGHVAIISDVGDDWVEVVQQNSEVTREKLQMEVKDGTYTIHGEKEPAGWLRIRK
ncbi:MAG: CHAP domain-containing protein [Peptococcaceae bacterium]|nr:CHAP domain-containing protein [Peptococcaceae bacterium]